MTIVITPSVSEKFIVDSSGWIEYLAAGPKADGFAAYLDSQAILLLPSIIAFEVYKKLYRERGIAPADRFLSQAFGYGERLIPLTLDLSVKAAILSADDGLSMADAIIYATARHHGARLVTSDAHFSNLPGVTMI
jgi:predicted nucleic acid-binding protein